MSYKLLENKEHHKKIIYILVLVLMFVPFLYFLEGPQPDLEGVYQGRVLQRQRYSKKQAGDIWYASSRNVREPEQSAKKTFAACTDLYTTKAEWNTLKLSVWSQEKREQTALSARMGTGNQELRAPPVII